MLKTLEAYCLNSSLTGLRYIANKNLHYTERIFWLLCVMASSVGSYLLIRDFQANFEQTAVSVTHEQLSDMTMVVEFPAVGVCEMDDTKYDAIEAYLVGLNDTRLRNERITQMLMALAFPLQYNANVYEQVMAVLQGNGGEHLLGDYRRLSAQFQSNCSALFEACFYLGVRIDCCAHFRPLMTTNGRCFLANSLQTARPDKTNSDEHVDWLPAPVEVEHIASEYVLRIHLRQPAEVRLLTAESLPFNSLETIYVSLLEPSGHKLLRFGMERLTNDATVRQIAPVARKCRFNDELLPQTRYAAYSFTACLSDCVRDWQLRLCNCTPYHYMPWVAADVRECNVIGYGCVEAHNLLRPHPIDLQPWRAATHCSCLPACTDSIFKRISEEQLSVPEHNVGSAQRIVTLSMQRPVYHYRRQSLRTRLDVVVTIGGIMGLFMGASVLSGIELLYYLTIRPCCRSSSSPNTMDDNCNCNETT